MERPGGGWGSLGGREDGRKPEGADRGVVEGSSWCGVRIMVVKLLFPPGEKKGVNDTLELPTPTRRSSLSFMEAERHTLSEVRRPGRQPCRPPAPQREALTKRKEEEEAR